MANIYSRKRNITLPFLCIVIFLVGLFSACSKSKSGKVYNPSEPLVLTSMTPDSGRYLDRIIIRGKNFGTDPEQIRVWFNEKKGAVVGSTGEEMLVITPRLPGDTCVVSVAIGQDSVTFDHEFYYHQSVSVTTIAGTGSNTEYRDGDLSQAIIQPRYLCVDKDDNLFMINFEAGRFNVAMIDEDANELTTIARDIISNVPAADPETGVITLATETTIGSFSTLDPREFWGIRNREMKWVPGTTLPEHSWKHAMVFNPTDNYFYIRFWDGELVRIDPVSYEAEIVFKTPTSGNTYGLTFVPGKPNILYMAFQSGGNANQIWTVDVSDPQNTFHRISAASSGFRDGQIEVAQFREPYQMFSDEDGNIYLADAGNHCIRRIRPDNIVETVLGIPGTPGWKDGNKEEALFNYPTGIGIASDGSVYVADQNNYRVRKLSIN